MVIYLMTHPDLNAVKVGIGVVNDQKSTRVGIHQRRGWQEHASWTGIHDIRVARAVERHILNRWSAEGIRGYLRPEHMPQSGATETAPLSRVNLDDLVGEITLAIEKYSDQYLADADEPSAA